MKYFYVRMQDSIEIKNEKVVTSSKKLYRLKVEKFGEFVAMGKGGSIDEKIKNYWRDDWFCASSSGNRYWRWRSLLKKW
jgi:hypothetical protein